MKTAPRPRSLRRKPATPDALAVYTKKRGRPEQSGRPFFYSGMDSRQGQVTHAPITAASGMRARTTGKICFMVALITDR